MTLAVFRQIPRSDEITGPLWGIVNYCHRDFYRGELHGNRIAACGIGHPHHREHRHVVWQDETDLRHAIIYPPEENPTYGMLTYHAARERLASHLKEQAEEILAHPEIRAALTRYYAEEFLANPRQRPFLRRTEKTIEGIVAEIMVDPSSLPFVPADELTDEERRTVEDAFVSSYYREQDGYDLSNHYRPADYDRSHYSDIEHDPRAIFAFEQGDYERLNWRLHEYQAKGLNDIVRAHPRLIGAVGSEEALKRRWAEYHSTRVSYSQESITAALAAHESDLAAINEREQAHRKLWSDVLELPHIYIAT